MRQLTLLEIAAVTAIVVGAQGCAQKGIEHTVQKVPPETETVAAKPQGDGVDAVPTLPAESHEAGEAAKAPSVDPAREEFRKDLAQKLERFDRQIADLRMKVGKLEAAARAEWDEKLAALIAKRDMLAAMLDEAMKATSTAWTSLTDRAHDTWDELEKAAREAREEL